MQYRTGRRRPAFLGVSVAVGLGLLAAACGGDDGGSSGTTAGSGTTVAGEQTTTTAAELTPKPGGTLVMGIEADTGNPWVPGIATPAISGNMIMNAVFDTLGRVGTDGKFHGWLAESITPNADYTVWTIKARPDITFHDGTPFDASAIQDNMVRYSQAPLVSVTFAPVKGWSPDPAKSTIATDGLVVVDPMTLEVRLNQPWVTYDIAIAGTYIASPTWVKAALADPSLQPKPVGTGPFIFESYEPGGSFKARRNPDYWHKPYPYLDAVEFRVVQDALSRAAALEAGDLDIIHTTNGESISNFRKNAARFPMVEFTEFGETQYTMLNVGDPDSPLSDARVRCAMAYATDAPGIIKSVGAGVNPVANGPFSPGQPGYLDNSGYPTSQDMAKAKELVAAWKADNPGKRLEIRLSTTQDQTNLVVAQAQQQWFQEAGFDKVEISQIEQAKYIITALLGDFNAFQWRNHGGTQMDSQRIWWHSQFALPPGQLALNFGRIRDPEIDRLLDENRKEPDPAKRTQYAEAVNRRFAEQCYNLWVSWTVWGIPHKADVQGITSYKTPDGAEVLTGVSGFFWVGSVWRS